MYSDIYMINWGYNNTLKLKNKQIMKTNYSIMCNWKYNYSIRKKKEKRIHKKSEIILQFNIHI